MCQATAWQIGVLRWNPASLSCQIRLLP